MEKKLLNEINEIKSMMGLVVEQPEVEEYNYKRAIQCFLNKVLDDVNLEVDGKWGKKTMDAIGEYREKKLGLTTTGGWGKEVTDKITGEDREELKTCIAKEGDFLDKLIGLFD